MRFRRLFFWATVLPAAAAAILMYRRGQPLGQIGKQVLAHPVGSLINELRHNA